MASFHLLLFGLAAGLGSPVLGLAAGLRSPGAVSPKVLQDPEPGAFGQMAPQSTDVRLADSIVHEDDRGGAVQGLSALRGAPGGGFAAVWRDHRDGMTGIYLARYSPARDIREPHRPIPQPHAGRRFDPAVEIAPDGSGGAAWIAPPFARANTAYLRCFDPQGEFITSDRPLSADDKELAAGRTARDAGASRVALVRMPKGGFAAAWTEEGRVRIVETDPEGVPRGEPVTVSREGARASPGVRLSADARGDVLALWTTPEGAFAVLRSKRDGAPSACGVGEPAALEVDPAGGFWALFSVEAQAVLRHLSPDGRPDRPETRPLSRPVRDLGLATLDTGLAILSSSAEGPLSVDLLDRAGGRTDVPSIAVPSEAARGVADGRLASNGATLLVAWTDQRNGDPDVYGRIVDPAAAPDGRLGPEKRLNTDTASADQVSPFVATAGARGVVVWQDKRSGAADVYARLLAWPGGLAAHEFQLPIEESADRPSPPRQCAGVAMREGGDFAVIWTEPRGRTAVLLARPFSADAKPACAPVLVDDGAGEATPSSAAIVALPADRGFSIAWTRSGGGGVWARRLAPDGALPSAPHRISDPADGEVGDVALALLDDRRLVAAWTARPKDSEALVRARFLGFDGDAAGSPLSFDATGMGGDWDPALAPAAGGGFAMAWTAGSPSTPHRDVVARVFDARGKPAGPHVPISPQTNEQDFAQITRLSDQSLVVAWEDDVSGYDHGYLRRIAKNGRDRGTTVLLNDLATKMVEDRNTPMIAPLGDGLVGAWIERRRSLGWDVYVRILGPRFDDVKKK